MKKNVLLLMATAMTAALTLGACHNNDEETPLSGVDLTQPISLNLVPAAPDAQSRVTIGITNSAFENGDQVGVYVSEEFELSNAAYSNVTYTYNGSEWSGTTDMYWPAENVKYNLTAYYPFTSVEDEAAVSVELPQDQSEAETYTAADYLWGRITLEATNESITIQLGHIMSLLKLDMKPGNGLTLAEISGMTPAIHGTIPATGGLNLEAGTINYFTSTSYTSIIPYQEYDSDNNTLTYYALVMPGTTFNQDEKFLTLTDGSTDYEYSLNISGGITATTGTYYELDLTVNRTDITLSSFSINNWAVGGSGSGSVDMI